MSSPHTISDVKKADRLWDDMSLREVSEETGIPHGTLKGWSRQDLISTDRNHMKGPREYDQKTVERANELYDYMPLKSIAEVLGVCYGTLRSWQRRGWIDTDRDWQAIMSGNERKGSIRRAVELVYGEDLKHKEAAERMGVARSTVSQYLKEYAQRQD